MVFDSVGKLGLKLMMTKVLKNMGIRDVEGLLFWGWLLFLMMACFFLFDRGEIAATNGFGVNFR